MSPHPGPGPAAGVPTPARPRARLDPVAGRPTGPAPATLDPEREPRSAGGAAAGLGRYAVLGPLGQGGMGTVYLARERDTGRRVALKLAAGRVEPRTLERFAREGRAAAALRHPGIVAIHATGETGGRPYLVYELVEAARDLTAAAAPLDLVGRARLLRDVARAVGHAHGRGVVHRDLKPENVLVDARGQARVTDFGLALVREEARLTRTGTVLGTPRYMAPEQIGGARERIGPPTDVWALGVILYELLTEIPPFEGRSFFELMGRILRAAPAAPATIEPAVPPALSEVCLRALSAAPEARYADGAALARAIDEALAARERRRSRRTLLVLGGVAALLVGLAGGRALRAGGAEPAPDVGPAAGRRAGVATTAAAVRPTSWLDALPEAERPPRPLPSGVAPSDAPGEYVSAVDGSVLVWVPASWSVERGFFLGKHEVTWAQYQAFCRATGRAPPAPVYEVGPEHPVHGVSRHDAEAYLDWAGLRLPSRAEWRWAYGAEAAGPSALRPGNRGYEDDGWPGSSPVGAFPAGAAPSGCLDMDGNVYEWLSDDHDQPHPLRRVPRGLVIGGAYTQRRPLDPTQAAAAATDHVMPNLGFRVARSPR